jgi:soluble lytic murein transglycosylase
MHSRHSVIYLLFFALAASISVVGPRPTHSAAPDPESSIPADAVAALREGRFLRASLILREYLSVQSDSTPSAILLAARAEAGWGDWERVHQLLAGRSWLDGVAAGDGWNLLGRSQIALQRWGEGSASLGRYLQVADTVGMEVDHGVVLLRRARALTEQRQYGAALTAYDDAAAHLPGIEDWVHVFAASAAASAGDTAAVRERLRHVDSTLAVEWSWRTLVRARRTAGDLAGAQSTAEQAAAQLTSETRRAAAWTMVGSIRETRGDRNGARAAYIRAMNVAQGSSAAIDAARSLSQMNGLSAEDQLLVGRVYLRHGNFQRGVAGINAYVEAGRGSAVQREQLRYEIANALFRAGDYRAAERALIDVAKGVSDRRVAADALYTAARAQYRLGSIVEARATLLHIVDAYYDQPAAVRAAYLTADLDHDNHDLDRAADFYRRAIRMSPTSAEAGLARMRLGGIAFANGRYQDALLEFDDYRTTHRTGTAYQQATYWSGRALDRLGQHARARDRFAEARRLDPFSYYGGLAADELGDVAWAGRLEHAPPQNDRFQADVERALARVDLLRRIGWDDAASFEMERVRLHFARFDGALYTLAEELNERGFTRAGVALGREIHRREGAWNLRLLRIVYPFPYRSIIMAEARERGVDPFLAAALIRQESMFNPDARSPVGAIGLMQVMPPTGQALARTLGINRFRSELLYQPELNIHFGMAYLADQIGAWGDRLDAVLAAYNAGPTRVARWQRFPEFADRQLFAERIPYDETRDYVRIVQNNRRLYAALYGE